MKALVMTHVNHLEYSEVADPSITADDEILVQVKAVGICGSDVHGMTGKTGRRIPPVIMGHEASGIVAGRGPGVSSFAAGDRVTFDSTIYCNACEYCLSGRVNLCSHRRVLGVSCADYRRDGAMAQYIVVPKHIVYRLPDAVSFETAALIEPVSVAFHAVRRASLSLGQSVAVYGCGIIGLLIIRAARLSGCGTLYAVDVNPARLAAARESGADVVIDSSKGDASAAIHERTEGVDVGFEAVGIAPTVKAATESVRKGGKLILVGNISPEVVLGLQSVVTREIDVLGSCASAGEYPAILQMIATGQLSLKGLISAVAPLSEGGSWFNRLSGGKEQLLKVILVPES
jgi:L-iditol 2-dehydrogenase